MGLFVSTFNIFKQQQAWLKKEGGAWPQLWLTIYLLVLEIVSEKIIKVKKKINNLKKYKKQYFTL